MAPPRAKAEDFGALVQAIREHGTVSEAARALGIPRGTAQHQAERAEALGLLAVKGQPSPRLPVTADECWEVINYHLGVKRMRTPKPPKWQAKKEQRIVVAGDFHAPYQDPQAVAELIAREAGRADVLCISGDLFDLYSVSRFPKTENVTIEQEWAAGTALLAQLAAAFPRIIAIRGNHDERVVRQLRAILPRDVVHALEILTGGDFCLINQAAKRHQNVEVAQHKAMGGHTLPWLVQIGDLIVSHAEKYSITPGAALRKVEESLSDFEIVYQLKDWRVLIQAHTHAHSVVLWHADKMLLEGGCMCLNPQGYQMSARIGGRSQRQGYITLTQVEGKTDINSVKFHWLNGERVLKETA